jgi:GYF domain 2
MAQWYYKQSDEKHGPVSPKELKQLADAGER